MPNDLSIASFLVDHGTTLVSVAASIVAGSIGLSKYLAELRETRAQQLEELKQKANELRWEQARVGKALNDEMLEDPESWGAMQMLDMENEGKHIRLPDDRSFAATPVDVLGAMMWRPADRETGPPGSLTMDTPVPHAQWIEIRTCFDSLFYYLAIIEHYLSSGLLHFDDVAYPLNYYVSQLAGSFWREQFLSYIDEYKLGKARKFLKRFEAWREFDRGPPDDNKE